MDALEAIRGRRSVRQYAAETPSREVVEQIIAEACQAPNSINRQAWRFVVVSDRHLLAEPSKEFVAEPYPGVIARPNCETPGAAAADGCSLDTVTA